MHLLLIKSWDRDHNVKETLLSKLGIGRYGRARRHMAYEPSAKPQNASPQLRL
jgi:hypothetical protein